MPDTNENDLFNELLGPGGGGQVDITRIGAQTQLTQVRDETQASRIILGLPVFDRRTVDQMVAKSHGTDLDLDDAFIAFLAAHPEVAARGVRPEVFQRLIKLFSGLSAVEQGATPLLVWLLDGVMAFNKENARLNGKVLGVLNQPLLGEVAPGITVKRARTLMGIVLRTVEQQNQLDQGRRDRHRRHRQQIDQQVAKAKKGLKQHQSVRRLRQAASQALPAAGDQGEQP